MLVGHLATAFLAKRIQLAVSLGTLVLAALLADILWPLFMLAGLEQVNFKPGMGAANYFDAVNIAMSHSNIAGPPPPNPRIAPVASLILFSFVVAWAYWLDQLRPMPSGPTIDLQR